MTYDTNQIENQGSVKRLTSIKVGDVGGSFPQTLTDVTVGGTILKPLSTGGMGTTQVVGGATPPNHVAALLTMLHSERVGTIRTVSRGGREKTMLIEHSKVQKTQKTKKIPMKNPKL